MSTFNDTTFLFRSLYKNRRLLFEMSRRDISDRYAGQILGAVWAVIHPVLTIAVFIFMFAIIFRMKVDSGLDIPGDHTLYMVSGLVPWLVVADVLGRSSTIVSSQASLVKQVVFPVEILPIKMVLASLPTFVIGYAGIVLYGFAADRISLALLLYPLAALPFYLFLAGMALVLASIGVFLRDVRELVQVYTLIGMYVAPIFYFMEWVPEQIRPFIYLNPLTIYVEIFHDSAYYGGIRSWLVWLVAMGIGCAATWFGAMVFARLKPYFGSYL